MPGGESSGATSTQVCSRCLPCRLRRLWRQLAFQNCNASVHLDGVFGRIEVVRFGNALERLDGCRKNNDLLFELIAFRGQHCLFSKSFASESARLQCGDET